MKVAEMPLDERDEEILEKQDDATLAKWWCELNAHGTPDGLPGYMPAGVASRRWQVMSYIMRRIGIKECLREWNRETLPGEAFDDWYKTSHRL